VIINFASSLQSLTVALEASHWGSFSEFGAAYAGSTQVASASVNNLTSISIPNTAVPFTLSSPAGFNSVVLGTTNDGAGFGIASVPGPIAGAGMPTLLAMLGIWRVCRRRSARNASSSACA
jgi:hypothetical protein